MAKILGSHRNANNGEHRSDIDTEQWAVEHKLRKTIPLWLWHAMEQAVGATTDAQRPVVILTQSSRGRKAKRLVVMQFEDFVDLMAGL